MSEWTHSICGSCWKKSPRSKFEPIKVVDAPLEHCCFCGQVTQEGIYTRHDPADPKLKCGGKHEPVWPVDKSLPDEEPVKDWDCGCPKGAEDKCMSVTCPRRNK